MNTVTSTNINQVLNQIRAYSRTLEATAAEPVAQSDFSQLLAQSLEKVSGMQNEATGLKTAYETGAPGIDLPEVMISVQKASLAFEATLEVRNKLLSAYQEIMNMQV